MMFRQSFHVGVLLKGGEPKKSELDCCLSVWGGIDGDEVK